MNCLSPSPSPARSEIKAKKIGGREGLMAGVTGLATRKEKEICALNLSLLGPQGGQVEQRREYVQTILSFAVRSVLKKFTPPA